MDSLGRLHPLLVHLPIGIVVLGIVLFWWDLLSPGKAFRPALKTILLLGALTAIASVLTGLLLAQQNDYDELSLSRHRNSGIALAVLSLYFWFLIYKDIPGRRPIYLSISLMLVLVFAGHYGASLTHGSGFLFGSSSAAAYQIKPIANVQEALAYQDVIDPILQQKCVSCHGADKQKGKLRLDNEEYVRKGGKNGEVVNGKEDAELLNRILLPPDDEDHMPPKGKGQLSKDQVALIKWWISEGADFKARVKDIKQDAAIKTSLVKLQGEQSEEEPGKVEELPEVDAAPNALIEQLKNSGVVVVPVAAGSNLLQVNLINMTESRPETWASLGKLSAQAWHLKADQQLVDNKAMAGISELKNLRRLSLAGASVNDSALVFISKLNELEFLNLAGTGVTAEGLGVLSVLKKLRTLYLFETKIDSADMSMIQSKLPGVKLETGRYLVPILESDTTRLK
jgi:mono/diheme cytochrome c family protein/uncharacterized membrane protein